MGETTRIDELKRRVEKDPASIAFAQLAEEYRRVGQFEEAVRVSRAGLSQHPAYLSARVTLGRALTDLEHYDEAQAELEYVLRAAPDNLPASGALADLHRRRGERHASTRRFTDAPHTGDDRSAANPPANSVDDISLPAEPDDRLFEQALASLDALTLDVPASSTDSAEEPPPSPSASGTEPPDPVLADLEGWLDGIVADRERRTRS